MKSCILKYKNEICPLPFAIVPFIIGFLILYFMIGLIPNQSITKHIKLLMIMTILLSSYDKIKTPGLTNIYPSPYSPQVEPTGV